MTYRIERGNSLIEVRVLTGSKRIEPIEVSLNVIERRAEKFGKPMIINVMQEDDPRFMGRIHWREKNPYGNVQDYVEFYVRLGRYQLDSWVSTTFKDQEPPAIKETLKAAEEMFLNANLVGTTEANGGETLLLSKQQLWALAASAVLNEKNLDRHDLLGAGEKSAARTENEKRLLKDWWGVTDRKSLLREMDSLKAHGYREEFKEFADAIMPMSDAAFADALAMVKDQRLAMKYAVVREYAPKLGSKALAGWDLSRYILLCRWGYSCDYMTEDEAWEKIGPVARELQRTFASWQELGENYVIGRDFWRPDETPSEQQATRAALDRLLRSPQSPWQQLPWNLDLSATTTAPVKAPASQHQTKSPAPAASRASN